MMDSERVQMDRLMVSAWDSFPAFELYVDQVVTIVNQVLEGWLVTGEDAVLTAPMVNNYVKSRLIQPPHKKRYTREQLCRLIIISVLKSVLSLTEISMLLDLLEEEAIHGSWPGCEHVSSADARIYEHFRMSLETCRAAINGASHPVGEPSSQSFAQRALLFAIASASYRLGSRRLIANGKIQCGESD